MRKTLKITLSILLMVFISVTATCQEKASSNADNMMKTEKRAKKKKRRKRIRLPNIDLSHWSVTIPELNQKGSALSVQPPEILNYAKDKRLIPYMYNDSIRGTLVFYSFPSAATTANTKYTRCELREQMVPGDNKTNWTFAQGAKMKGDLAMGEVSKDSDGKYHRVIIMQIHGILTDEQRDLIGQKDNNAPPILKIYWQDGKIRVKTKILKNLNATGPDLLHEEAWDDDDGFNFEQEVGFGRFTLEVKVSDGEMVIILNNSEYKVYDGIHMRKWGIFENYFKAGNYFQSRDEGAYARVKYYKLEVSH
ncbi:polysaccharide lyase family 7 protein [Flavobacterium faecale]|uniref:Polysaccharide lyase family 7 protein n=1 Tax=Flavobacterium faecale TaxID=1355330 RepID=A0A2S1L8X0_9FLAO|nr:polysaccharide lyase family 7 protein [Flavobacterium faecale]AWG20195.1 polysaccharide lyase family 7 protein [Flavobacterium faecale]QMT62777.1 polysaccharide lyase family 7 alginate lyase [Flavobacterium sp.]